MVIDIFMSMGGNYLLVKDTTGIDNYIANAILELEHCDGMGDFRSASHSQGMTAKLRDLC